MSSASRVQRFLEEVGAKRPAPPAAQAAGETLLLPITLQMDHNPKGDAPREQLLWRLGDTKAVPAAVARAFAAQHIQQPQQQEQQAARLTRDLEKILEQHKDLVAAPRSPTLVKLEVRCTLAHLGAMYADELLWDLGAPRAACEAYISQVCSELRLDWHAHTLIMRNMKDAIDAAARDYAAGKIQVVPPPSSGELQRSTPARYPHVVTREGLQSMREVLPGRQGAAGSAAAAGGGSGAAAAAKLDGSGDDEDMPDLGFEES